MVLHGCPRLDQRTRICSLVTMEAATRSYEAVPPEAAVVLRPVLPALSDETIAAIAREVPSYARAMEGEFGQVVRRGVEVAFNRFVDLLADPAPGQAGSSRTYVDLGRGEFHAGRSLDALLAAYRVGARLAWRRFVEAGVAGGLSPAAIYSLGEAIFAYIDELSAESAEGYAEEQSVAAGESERRRRRLVRLLAQDPPAGQEAVRTAAAAATWALPRGLAALVAGTGAGGSPGEAHLDSLAARLARRLGEGAIGAEAVGAAVVFVPDPDAPGRRRRLETAIRDRAVALGPTVEWTGALSSVRRAIATHRLAATGRLGDGADRPDRRRRAPGRPAPGRRPHRRRRSRGLPAGAARDAPRQRAGAPAGDARGVAGPPGTGPGGGRRARRPPPDRALPRAPAARPVRRPARRSRRAFRALPRVTCPMTTRRTATTYRRCACS